MSPDTITHLHEVGRSLNRWKAELKLTLSLTFITLWLCVLGILDLWLRVDRTTRLIAWLIFLGIVGFAIRLVRTALHKRFTTEGVAATLERAFPELDNRLINYVQLARNPEGDPFKAAYIQAGIPPIQRLDIRSMRDEKIHRRNWIALGSALALLLGPMLLFGQAWRIALWRTVNPFTSVAPPSLTRILAVEPGSITVLQGTPLSLLCSVAGFQNHPLQIEIETQDAQKAMYSLGRLRGEAQEKFSYDVPKVTTPFRYRFKAGDASPSAWFSIGTKPPPSFTEVSILVSPPAYMRLPSRTINPRDGKMTIPAGSQLRITSTSNTPLESVGIRGINGELTFCKKVEDNPKSWVAELVADSGSALSLRGEDRETARVEEEFLLTLEADKAARIEVVSPTSKATLPQGARPQIEFRVEDDYGIQEIVLEAVKADATGEEAGEELKRWTPGGSREFYQMWRAETAPDPGSEIAYRLVVRDNKPSKANESHSVPILFSIPSAGEVTQKRDQLELEASATLQKIAELQTRNLADTTSQARALAFTTPAQWKNVSETQNLIRSLMRELLANPLKPLGDRTAGAQKIYVHEMVLAVDALLSVPTVPDNKKASLAAEAIALETTILRHLTGAVQAAGDTKVERRVDGLQERLQALIREQIGIQKRTQTGFETQTPPPKDLIAAQDKMAKAMLGFVTACKEEAAQSAQTDAAFATTLENIVAQAKELRIRENMLIASERLEQNQAAEALPLQERILSHLKALQAQLDLVKLQEQKEKQEALVEAVHQSKEKLEKIEALAGKLKEAMEQVKGQKDKDDQKMDELEEEANELRKNIKEAMLQVPNDLHIFKELNVANDLVEDVFSTFQEVEQKEGPANGDPDAVKEKAFAKDEALLAQMGEAKKRMDALEMWLSETADETKYTAEAFDQAEMPSSGIALAELAAAAQDLIGDLLKQDEETAKKADDSATNHAVPNMTPGGKVEEGELSSFAAQGKSGNNAPDHREQDGRSNVGRQGMSNGETASASGTIGEGDKKIEARRTEDPIQSGKVDLAGEADTKATGGGKLGTGKADDKGMSGGAERVDSKEAGSDEGMAALMARQADALYAKASMKNIRVDSLKNAAHELRQASDAIAKGNIEQMREFRKMAISSLNRAAVNLSATPNGAMEAKRSTGALENLIQSGPDQAPPKYREKVSDYFKALSGAL